MANTVRLEKRFKCLRPPAVELTRALSSSSIVGARSKRLRCSARGLYRSIEPVSKEILIPFSSSPVTDYVLNDRTSSRSFRHLQATTLR
jgi:hypothetical protein